MAAPMDDWRSLNKRKIIIQKLEERIKALGNPPSNLQNPIEVEKAFFDKSKSEEEYMNYFHNVILMLTRQKQGQTMTSRPMMNMGPGQQMNMNQPNTGYQQQPYNQFGGVGGPPSQVPNPNYPPGGGMGMGGPQRPQPPPQYHPGMYPPGGNPNTGMHVPQQPRYPMPQGYPQQGRGMGPSNFNSHHVMPGGGGYNTGGMPGGPFNQAMMPGQGGGMHGPMMRPSGMMPNPMRMAQRPGMPGQMPPQPQGNQAPYVMDGVGNVQPVQAIPNPYSSQSIRPTVSTPAYSAGAPTSTSGQLVNQQGSGPTPYNMINSASPATPKQAPHTSIPPSSMSQIPPSSGGVAPAVTDGQQHPQPSTFPGSPSVANPATPHAGTLQGPVPSPAPPTPLCPASPATSGIDSPAMQPAMTPEENEMYVRKLGELQKYIPLMSKWMSKLSKDGRKSDQFLKLKSLYNLLQDNNRRVPLQTLMKCGVALEKMFDSQTKENTDSSNSAMKNPASLPPPSTSSSMIVQTGQNEPVVPEPKFSSPPQSQSLLDFKMIPSPPAMSGCLMDEVLSDLMPDERLPPAKRVCFDFEDPPYPPSLVREFPHLKQFDIEFLPKKDQFDKSTTLKCSLSDEDLPQVPPLTVVLPPTYPSVPPVCDLSHYQKDPSPFIKEAGRLLSDKLARKTSNYSFTTLLDYWEMSVLRAIAKELMVEDD